MATYTHESGVCLAAAKLPAAEREREAVIERVDEDERSEPVVVCANCVLLAKSVGKLTKRTQEEEEEGIKKKPAGTGDTSSANWKRQTANDDSQQQSSRAPPPPLARKKCCKCKQKLSVRFYFWSLNAAERERKRQS